MTDRNRAALRSFLQASVTGEPRSADYADAGLDGPLESAARRWVGVVRRAASPAPGARNAQRAAELVDEATDALLEALPDEWEPPRENPTELADQIRRW